MNYGVLTGLFLKIIRNGIYALVASGITILKPIKPEKIIPENFGEEVELALNGQRLPNSFIIEINVFEDAQISWGNPINNPEGIQTNKIFCMQAELSLLKK